MKLARHAQCCALALFLFAAMLARAHGQDPVMKLPKAEGDVEYMSPSGLYSTDDDITVHCAGWIKNLEEKLWMKARLFVALQRLAADPDNEDKGRWVYVGFFDELRKPYDNCDCEPVAILDAKEKRILSFHKVAGKLSEGNYRVKAELQVTFQKSDGSLYPWYTLRDKNGKKITRYSYFDVRTLKSKGPSGNTDNEGSNVEE